MNNDAFNRYIKTKLDHRIDSCNKRLEKAELKRDLTEYIRMEAKIDAYVDIWSFFNEKTSKKEEIHGYNKV